MDETPLRMVLRNRGTGLTTHLANVWINMPGKDPKESLQMMQHVFAQEITVDGHSFRWTYLSSDNDNLGSQWYGCNTTLDSNLVEQATRRRMKKVQDAMATVVSGLFKADVMVLQIIGEFKPN